MLQQLSQGIQLDDGMAKFEAIIDSGGEGTNHWYHVVLKEGKNREVRRLWESVGVEVSRLVRVRYDNFQLPKWLKPGKYRFFEDEVVKRLYRKLELDYMHTVNPRKTVRKKRIAR
jgi:23S rRNA pseudouridine2605 synthase